MGRQDSAGGGGRIIEMMDYSPRTGERERERESERERGVLEIRIA